MVQPDRPPAFRYQQAAARNQEFSTELSGLTRTLERTLKGREAVSLQLQRLGASLDRARHQLEIVGLDEDLGKLLREQREQLPSIKRLRDGAEQTRSQIAKTRLELFRQEDRRDRLATEDLLAGPGVEDLDDEGKGSGAAVYRYNGGTLFKNHDGGNGCRC